MAPARSEITAREVASFLDCEFAGPETSFKGVDSLDNAGPGDLAFSVYDDPALVEASDAGVVICLPSVGRTDAKTLVFSSNPRAAFARTVREFFVDDRPEGIHPTAVVESGATLGEDCRIGPGVYVADCVVLGDQCTVRANTTLGCGGFGFPRGASGTPYRLPHTGGVRLGDNVEVGANSSIDRSVFGNTVVGDRSKVSANVHLAHGVQIGQETYVTYGCGVAGSVSIGDGVKVNPHVTVATDVSVGDGAELGMNATVLDDVSAHATVVGSPAREIGD